MEHIFRRRHKEGLHPNLYFSVDTGKTYYLKDGKEIEIFKDQTFFTLSDSWHPIEPWTGIKDSKRTEQYPEGQMIFLNDLIVLTDECGTQTWGSVKWFSDEGYPAFDVYPRIDCDSNGLSHYTAVGEIEVVGVAVIGSVDT